MAQRKVQCSVCLKWLKITATVEYKEVPIHFLESAPYERCAGVGRQAKAKRGF